VRKLRVLRERERERERDRGRRDWNRGQKQRIGILATTPISWKVNTRVAASFHFYGPNHHDVAPQATPRPLCGALRENRSGSFQVSRTPMSMAVLRTVLCVYLVQALFNPTRIPVVLQVWPRKESMLNSDLAEGLGKCAHLVVIAVA